MNSIQEVSQKIFKDSKGLSKAQFSIIPYQQELSYLEPLDFVVWQASYSQLYFLKLMYATAFVWKDLSWEQWQEALSKVSCSFQSLFNLLTFLTQFLEIDTFMALKNGLSIEAEMVDRLKVFFEQPMDKPSVKELKYLSQLNEMKINLAEIRARLYHEGAPRASLVAPIKLRSSN